MNEATYERQHAECDRMWRKLDDLDALEKKLKPALEAMNDYYCAHKDLDEEGDLTDQLEAVIAAIETMDTSLRSSIDAIQPGLTKYEHAMERVAA